MDKAISKLTIDDRDTIIALYKLHQANPNYSIQYPDKLVTKWLKKDKKDPLFLVWELAESFDDPSEKDIANIRKTAEKRGDNEAMKALDAFIKSMDDVDEGSWDTGGVGDQRPEDIERTLAMLTAILKPLKPSERIRILMKEGFTRAQAEAISNDLDLMDLNANPRIPNANQGKAKKKVAPKPTSRPNTGANQDEFDF